MKRLYSIIFLFVILGLLLFSLQGVSFAQDLEGVPASVNTPQTLADWFSSEFGYRFEMTDEWQDPQVTIDSKEGDCEDFAVLASRVLCGLGISNDILVVKFKDLKIAHAICAWKDENGKYSFISNRNLVRTGKSEIDDAIGKYYPDYEGIIFTDENRRYIGMIGRGK
ncbi:MAG: transglutaminase-like domain-containing protein [Candidatus Omnitrophota bacterium]